MSVDNPKQVLESKYGDVYYKMRGFCDETVRQYSRKEKLFNLEWASRWSGINWVSGQKRKALDAGCGVGINARILKNLGYDVTGLDCSDFAIQEAKTTAAALGDHDIEWRVGNLDTDPIPGEYDLIICWEVIEHVQNPEAVLRKLYAALRPGGILILTTPNRLGLSHWLLPADPTHIHVHSPFWWARKLRKLPSSRWICRSMMFWDHMIPWLRRRKKVLATRFPAVGFRIRMAVIREV